MVAFLTQLPLPLAKEGSPPIKPIKPINPIYIIRYMTTKHTQSQLTPSPADGQGGGACAIRHTWMLALVFISSLSLYAQPTPKWAKKARTAVFSIVTYDGEEKILATGNGFFIGETGEAVADYTLFRGAERAVVITTGGKQLPVTHILGANEMYDLVKFRVDAGREKLTALTIDTTGVQVGETVWMLPYSTSKTLEYPSGKVEERVTAAERYAYYTLRMPMTDKLVSCPVMNEAGEVVALLQKPYGGQDNMTAYAVDAHFAANLSIGALAGNSSALRAIGIKKALPPTEQEALVYLYMNSGRQPDEYLEMLNDFITDYPNHAEGYQRRAALYVQSYRDSAHFQLAEADMARAMELNPDKADAHYAMCRLITANATHQQPLTYKDWTLHKAIGEIDLAIAIDTLPLYLQTKGDLHFALAQYPEAYTAYCRVNRTNMANATTWYAAAQALQLTGDTARTAEVVTLMTRAIETYARPYPREVAPYIWHRAQALMADGRPREAVRDYNEYHTLMGGQVSPNFYYLRSQAALAGRMNQIAVDDLRRAVELSPDNADYLTEQASVCARFNLMDEAIQAARRVTELLPDYPDAHRILGVCLGQQGKKAEARTALLRAKELGDPQAEALIERYR